MKKRKEKEHPALPHSVLPPPSRWEGPCWARAEETMVDSFVPPPDLFWEPVSLNSQSFQRVNKHTLKMPSFSLPFPSGSDSLTRHFVHWSKPGSTSPHISPRALKGEQTQYKWQNGQHFSHLPSTPLSRERFLSQGSETMASHVTPSPGQMGWMAVY